MVYDCRCHSLAMAGLVRVQEAVVFKYQIMLKHLSNLIKTPQLLFWGNEEARRLTDDIYQSFFMLQAASLTSAGEMI
jgi:hypothetical protein